MFWRQETGVNLVLATGDRSQPALAVLLEQLLGAPGRIRGWPESDDFAWSRSASEKLNHFLGDGAIVRDGLNQPSLDDFLELLEG